jgi:hypothetical protein
MLAEIANDNKLIDQFGLKLDTDGRFMTQAGQLQGADVRVETPITVQPSPAPDVRVEAPITIQPARVDVTLDVPRQPAMKRTVTARDDQGRPSEVVETPIVSDKKE